MSLLSIAYPLNLEYNAHCRNRLYPDANFYAQAHAGINHLTRWRHKEVFRRSLELGSFTRLSGTTVVWRFRFFSGYGAKQLQMSGILGLSNTAAADPYVSVAITKVGGATTTTDFHGGATDTSPNDAPSEWIPFDQVIDIDPASAYEGTVSTVDYGVCLSLVVRELGQATVDDTVSFYSEHEPIGMGPIFDLNQETLLKGTGNMLRANGALQVSWCRYDGSARTRTSATAINLIDDSSTSPPTSTSPGYRFVTTARNTASRTTIPVIVFVYASIPSGSGTVMLRDTGGTDAVTVTVNNSTPQWFSGTGSISVGTGQKYDLYYAGSGTQVINVRAVSLYEYET